jgi:hypothetical protein
MSNRGWQESQEALNEEEESMKSNGTRPSPKQGGIMKTEEFTVQHKRGSFSDENSIELKPMGLGSGGDDEREKYTRRAENRDY